MTVKHGMVVTEQGGMLFTLVCRLSHDRVGGGRNNSLIQSEGGLPENVREKIRNHHIPLLHIPSFFLSSLSLYSAP